MGKDVAREEGLHWDGTLSACLVMHSGLAQLGSWSVIVDIPSERS